MKVLSKLMFVYKIRSYVDKFFSYLEYYFLCLIDNYRHNICKTQKPPPLIYHTIGANYTYMTKFQKKVRCIITIS